MSNDTSWLKNPMEYTPPVNTEVTPEYEIPDTSIKETLPKLRPGYITRYWYLDGLGEDDGAFPDDMPETESVFNAEYSEEDQAAVDALLAEGGMESVFPASELPEKMKVSKFLGVYNVEAPLNEATLASPRKADPNDYGAIVKHYNSTTSLWETVNDVEIIDDYVYATFTNLSPVAVLTYTEDESQIDELPDPAVPGTDDTDDGEKSEEGEGTTTPPSVGESEVDFES